MSDEAFAHTRTHTHMPPTKISTKRPPKNSWAGFASEDMMMVLLRYFLRR